MKVYIAFNISKGSSGGGNQFLNNLYNEFIRKNVYTNYPDEAEIIIFNGHHDSEGISTLKNTFPNKVFVHRIDGLYKLYNNVDDTRQDIAFKMNEYFSDATIFQSNWAYEEHIKQGLRLKNKPYTIIENAANDKIFYPKPPTINENTSRKVNIISTIWSPNPNKGVLFYEYLDSNLDFKKYTFTLVGNSSTKFKHIKHIPSLGRGDLANELKCNDIFLFPSKYECCSNSLIEGMSCGLVAVALNSGGNIELINRHNAGVLFNTNEDLISKIEEVSRNIGERRDKITPPTLDDVSNQYINFFERCIKSISV
jgi:glycosyltransferase involved in cell wall biosynthesis